jgi:hypothetical protein
MLSRMAWSLCSRAFEASRDTGITRPVRRSLQQFGVVWFWVALTLDGRALEVWRDYRTVPARLAGGVPVQALEALGELPVLAAWSLPNNPKMQGLGLGRVWVVTCPFCRHFHMHAPEEGSRPAHCSDALKGPALYALRYEGELPRGLWERFRLSAVDDKPRLLRPPYRDLQPDALEAA